MLPRALAWIATAAHPLERGLLLLIDYGARAAELYDPVRRPDGTARAFVRHRLHDDVYAHVGRQDLTAHVDFTSIRRAAEAEGCTTLGFLDQMYFLLALVSERLPRLNVKERLGLKTLVMPGGLGSTMKVLILAKGVGRPQLAGLSSYVRVT